MKISQNQVTKLTISDVPNLDAVDVIVEDFGPGRNHHHLLWRGVELLLEPHG